MKYYLIRDKQGNIIVYNFNTLAPTKITMDEFSKSLDYIRNLEKSLGFAEYVKNVYSNSLKEELEVVEVEVELDIKISTIVQKIPKIWTKL